MATTTSTTMPADEAGGSESAQERPRLILLALLFALAISVTLLDRHLSAIPPRPNFAGYYDGPWVNMRGTLVAPDGTTQQEHAAGDLVTATALARGNHHSTRLPLYPQE